MNKESIVLGSGDLYCTEFTGTNAALPSNEVLETEENRLGHIKGGDALLEDGAQTSGKVERCLSLRHYVLIGTVSGQFLDQVELLDVPGDGGLG